MNRTKSVGIDLVSISLNSQEAAKWILQQELQPLAQELQAGEDQLFHSQYNSAVICRSEISN